MSLYYLFVFVRNHFQNFAVMLQSINVCLQLLHVTCFFGCSQLVNNFRQMQIYAAPSLCFKSFFWSLHTSYFQRGLMCYKIGGKMKNRFGQHELTLIFYSVFFAPSVRKSQTKLSLACAEFTLARVELSPVRFSDLICVELTQVRVSAKF